MRIRWFATTPAAQDEMHPQLYFRAFVVVVVCTLIAAGLFPHLDAANLSMIYLAGVVIVALYQGRGPSILATVLSVASFDFFFTHPYGTFVISDLQYVLTLVVMLMVALTISTLAARSKEQSEAARAREHLTASLYTMSRRLADAASTSQMAQTAAEHIAQEFKSDALVALPSGKNGLENLAASSASVRSAFEPGVANWAFQSRQNAGKGTSTIPASHGLYIPLNTMQQAVGVLALYSRPEQDLMPKLPFIQAFAEQTAAAIERLKLTETAEQARTQAEAERTRNALLSSVSHDFRTPLASIMGAASTLREKGGNLKPETRNELAEVVYEEAYRLNRLIANLLDMTRLESGGLKLNKEWQTVEEVAGAALHRIGKHRGEHPLTTHLPPDLPLVPMDSLLIEQVLVNLIENAVKYTPSDTPIELSASASESELTISVADRGPGIPSGDELRIFEKFYRAAPKVSSGSGLGLAISQGIVEAHGGHIWAENRPSGGAVFRFTLPIEPMPEVADDDESSNRDGTRRSAHFSD
jgi:two-component system sensor histidine kinase KdpD